MRDPAARGLSVEQAAILIGVFNADAAGGKLATGTMTDRFGNRLPLLLLALLGAAVLQSELAPDGMEEPLLR